MLIYGIVVTLSFLWLALRPDRRSKAIEARIAQGNDAFFEEQRSYQAYPCMRNRKHLRIVGIIGTVCGLILCGLELYRSWPRRNRGGSRRWPG